MGVRGEKRKSKYDGSASKSLSTLGLGGFWAAHPALFQQTQQPARSQTLPHSRELQSLQYLSLSHILILKRFISELLANTMHSVSFSFHYSSLKSPLQGTERVWRGTSGQPTFLPELQQVWCGQHRGHGDRQAWYFQLSKDLLLDLYNHHP